MTRFEILSVLLMACSSSAPVATGFRVVDSSGTVPSSATVGDALQLSVLQTFSDGTTKPVGSDATLVWSIPTVLALNPDATADTRLPSAGDTPTAFLLVNASRPDLTAALAGTVFFLDAGGTSSTLALDVHVTTSDADGHATASINVAATPNGDATHGQTVFKAACSTCHGDTGHGQGAPVQGTSPPKYTIDGADYLFPVPGLNAEPDNAAADPDWNAGLLAIAARADIDDGAVSLRLPMPSWMTTPNPVSQQPFTTQDFADIFAFLKTQTH
jgi:mono/diheme cytochrome c family protein